MLLPHVARDKKALCGDWSLEGDVVISGEKILERNSQGKQLIYLPLLIIHRFLFTEKLLCSQYHQSPAASVRVRMKIVSMQKAFAIVSF